MIGLSNTNRQIIIEILRRYLLDGQKVYFFGSRTKENYKPFSDVDIFVEGNKLSLQQLLSLKEDFSESDLPYFVDILQEDSCEQSFLEMIKTDLVELEY